MPPQLTSSLYVPSPNHYLADRGASEDYAPGPGAGSVRPYSLPSDMKDKNNAWNQPARIVSPPQRSVHSLPDYDQELPNAIGGQVRQAMGNSFPTFVPGMQRAAGATFGIESGGYQGNYMILTPPDKYNALTARIRKARDVRSGFLADKFSRRRAAAPPVGA